jgi:diaminopimelate decarboxylase
VSMLRAPGPRAPLPERGTPRRGRPPGRNEILRNGRLGGVDAEELAAAYGTPFYAYDLDVVDRQVTALRAALPASFDLAYALKANPCLAIVGHLGRLGLGADVASGGELAQARRAGIAPGRIVFTGPGKRDPELEDAVAARVRAVTVESVGELERLERVASVQRHRQPVLLRAAVSEATRLARVRLVGDDGAGKFGMDDADLRLAARMAAASPHLELLGLHAFGASNVLDAAALATHVEATVARAESLAAEAGSPLRLVDAGGGLGVPYEMHEDGLDLVGLGRRLHRLADALVSRSATRATRVLLEPGRFLVAAAGAYVARVIDRKSIAGQHVVILDGGIHHVLRPTLVGQEHRVKILSGRAARAATTGIHFPVTVAGPLCSGLDVFAQATAMGVPDPGDLVGVLDVGAYGATESMPFFLSHPLPAEIVLLGGRPALARPRIEPDAWMGWQVDPGPG